MRKLGVGVFGVGEMGRRHAENLRRLVPEARLVAVASATGAPDRARQTAHELEIEHSFASLEAMLECKDLDAVLIAAPDKFHAQAIAIAARAGKDILCEKPLALNLADAQAALHTVAKAHVRLQIGFMRRYDPAYLAAMKRVEAGEIGVPVIFKSVGRDKDAPPLAAYQSKVNGMLLYNNTIHDFDMGRWLMRDEITEVHCYTTVAIRPEIAEYDDVVASVVNLRYRGGAIGNVESYVQAAYGYDVRTEIVGSKGSILVGSFHQTPATFLTANGGTQILADHFLTRFADAYVAEVRDFVQNTLNDRPPRVSGEDGLKAHVATRRVVAVRQCTADLAIPDDWLAIPKLAGHFRVARHPPAIARVPRGPDVPIADVRGHRSQSYMSRVLMDMVDVSKAEMSPQHLRSRSEIFPCHIAPECRSDSFASSFSASAAPFLSHPSNRLVPRAFSETAFASVPRRE